MSLLLRGVNIVDAQAPEERKQQSACISGRFIRELGDAGTRRPAGDEQVFDLEGLYLVPGLWDVHCHPGGLIPDYHKVTAFETQAERTLRALVNLQSCIPNGFTGMRVVSEGSYIDIALKERFLAGDLVGPRMVVCGRALIATGGHGSYRGVRTMYVDTKVEADGPYEFAKAAREQLKMGADQIKIMISGGIAGGRESMDEPQMTYEEMRAVVEVAQSKGTLVCAHAGGDQAIQTALRAGVLSIEHGYYMSEETIHMMKDAGAFYVPTIPVTQDRDFMYRHKWPEHSIERALAGAKTHLEGFKLAKELGVPIVNGADLNPFSETLHMGMRHLVLAGMTPHEALEAATLNAAKLCGISDQLGTVAVGKLADLVVVEGNPLEDVSNLEKVKLVLVDGRVVFNSL